MPRDKETGKMKKEPEIIYLTGKESLQDKIMEITKGDEGTQVKIFLLNYGESKLYDEKIGDDQLDIKDINTLVNIVERRGDLIDKIKQGRIKMREGK